MQQMREELKGGGAGAGGNRMTGEEKGRTKAMAETVYNEVKGAGIDDSQFMGVG